MLRLDLRDGTSVGFTDHDRDLTFNLGDGAIVYQAGTGILTSDIAMSAGLDTDNYEVTGPLADVVTLPAVLGGRFDRARARLFEVNWNSLASGAIRLLAGSVSSGRVEGGRFIAEVRSDVDRLNQVVGRVITNNCDADYGDARCKKVRESTVGTVTAVTDAMRFTVSYSGSYADDYFNGGTVQALTGDLAGTAEIEIFNWSESGATELFVPLASDPEIGDTFTIYRGCGKSRADCMERDNILNFRGFPEVPGSDQVLRAAIPGEGDQ